MDKFTFLREDLDSLAEAGLSDEEIGIVMLAMARYCMDGQEPDFQGPALRVAFALLRKRLDKYVKKCEANTANGQTGGRPRKPTENPTETQPKPNETQQNPTETQPEATETYDYDYEYDEEQGVEHSVAPRDDTHTDKQQQGNARAREAWFDPAHPDRPEDGAWRYSQQARKATAQRILTYVLNSGRLKEQFRSTEAGAVGEELFAALCIAMQTGLSPRECLQMADDCRMTWQWERDLKKHIVDSGGAAAFPQWRDQVAELTKPLMAYG